MTIDWTQPVETTEDPPRPVRVLATDRIGSFPVVIMFKNGDICSVHIEGWGSNGLRLRNVAPPKPEPVLREAWVNLYPSRMSSGFDTEDRATAVADTHNGGRVECRRIAWMSDGSPVPGEEKGLAVKLNKMTSDRDRWRTKAEALQAEVDRVRKAYTADMKRMTPVVDAAVAGVDSFNRRGLLRLIEAVRAYQQSPKKTAAEAVANVAAMMGPVKNCATCRFGETEAAYDGCAFIRTITIECDKNGFSKWEPRHD